LGKPVTGLNFASGAEATQKIKKLNLETAFGAVKLSDHRGLEATQSCVLESVKVFG
jgi:hypothetical protein